MWGNAPGVKLFYPAKLVRLQPGSISYYVFNSSVPPFAQICRTRNESGKLPKRRVMSFCIWLKLQEE